MVNLLCEVNECPMSQLVSGLQPPYYAVIFSSVHTEQTEGYQAMAQRMLELATQQPGFLGIESAREGIGITVSYWRNLDDIHLWRQHSEHQVAQKLGRQRWYKAFQLRISKVERAYAMEENEHESN